MDTGHEEQSVGGIELRELRVFPAEGFHVVMISYRDRILTIPYLKIKTWNFTIPKTTELLANETK